MSDSASDWIELSFATDMSVAKEEARRILLSHGIHVDDLPGKLLRLDIGRAGNYKTFYRVRVRRSVLTSSPRDD